MPIAYVLDLGIMGTDVSDESGDGSERNSRRPNPVDAHVGGRVRLRRMLLGISQEKLGEQLGLTFQQIQKYEKGVNRIGASRLFDLSKVLNVPVQFFYDEAPGIDGAGAMSTGFAEAPADAYIAGFLNTREGVELNKAYARISDLRTRRAILDLVRSLAPDDGPDDPHKGNGSA